MLPFLIGSVYVLKSLWDSHSFESICPACRLTKITYQILCSSHSVQSLCIIHRWYITFHIRWAVSLFLLVVFLLQFISDSVSSTHLFKARYYKQAQWPLAVQLFKNSSMKELPPLHHISLPLIHKSVTRHTLLTSCKTSQAHNTPQANPDTQKQTWTPEHEAAHLTHKKETFLVCQGCTKWVLTDIRGEVWKFTSLLQHQGQWVAGWVSTFMFFLPSFILSMVWTSHPGEDNKWWQELWMDCSSQKNL